MFFRNIYTLFCCCHANMLFCCWEDRNPMHICKDYQICLLRFVCLDLFLQICFFRFVSSDLFLQICVLQTDFFIFRFVKFVQICFLYVFIQIRFFVFCELSDFQISQISLFVQISQISQISQMCLFTCVSSDSFLQMILFRCAISYLFHHMLVSLDSFLQIRFFRFVLSNEYVCSYLVIQIRFFRFICSDSFASSFCCCVERGLSVPFAILCACTACARETASKLGILAVLSFARSWALKFLSFTGFELQVLSFVFL